MTTSTKRRNIMATNQTTHSKKLRKATKIGAVKPLDKPAVPTPTTSTTPTENISLTFSSIKTE
jgi:hypothetical protein